MSLMIFMAANLVATPALQSSPASTPCLSSRSWWLPAVLTSMSPRQTQANAPATQPPSETAATDQASSATSVPDVPSASVILDDASKPVSGTIEPPLDVVEANPDNWLNIAPQDEWLNFIRDPLRELDERHGLSISGAYTMLFQHSMGPNAHSAGAGDFDLFVRWTPLGRGTPDTGSFYMATEFRHDIGAIPPSELGSEIGTLLGTTDGFSDRGWSIKDAYWAQRLFDDHFRFGIGRVDSENLVGNHNLQSANTSFLNKAFSVNPTMAFPGSGFGAAAAVRLGETFYVSGGATNAYGNTTTNDLDELDEGRFFKFAEAGVTPNISNWGEGRYRVAIWHMDSRSLTDQPSDSGISLIADQKIGERLSIFARYGYSEADLTGVRHSAQAGAAIQGLIGSANDLTGLAMGWSEPEADLSDEKVVEVFHRLQLTGRTQVTVGAQLIIDPSNAPDVDALGVFSARLRVAF